MIIVLRKILILPYLCWNGKQAVYIPTGGKTEEQEHDR